MSCASYHPYDSFISLGLHINQGNFFTILQTTNLARDRLITVSLAHTCKAIKSDLDSNRIELRKIAS